MFWQLKSLKFNSGSIDTPCPETGQNVAFVREDKVNAVLHLPIVVIDSRLGFQIG